MMHGKLLFKPEPVSYVVEHKYNPDFLLMAPEGKLLVEVKGYFQESSEAAKYIWVRKSLPEGEELVFVFERPQTEFHWLKKRKDGTRQTMAEWADKNEFRWFTLESFKEQYFVAKE